MEGVGQKRFSGVWTPFAKGLYDWSFGYSNVNERALGETDVPKSAFDLEYELDKLLVENFKDIDEFYKKVASALRNVIDILPRILMSDKSDVRYEQVVRQYCEEHPEVLLHTYIDARKRGPGVTGSEMLDAGFFHAPYIPLQTIVSPKF